MGFFTRKKKDIPAKKAAMRFYNAASTSNITASWLTSSTSGASVLRRDLKKLQARSRILAENDPYFADYRRKLATNVLGEKGIRLQSKIFRKLPDGSSEIDKDKNDIVEKLWKEWGKKESCTADGQTSFFGVQKAILKTVATDGEIFIRILRGKRYNRFGFSLQLLEADHVDTERNENLANGNYIRM